MIVAGIDVGAGSTKAVVMEEGGRILGRATLRTKADFNAVAREALEAAGGPEPDYVASTGLGRFSVSFRDIQVTDITCAARGAWFLHREASFVLDMGAQSTRAVRVKEDGRVREFHVNEKCAAGSGSFLERAARYLEVPIDQVGDLSMRSTSPRAISSVCAVLAESEIINLVSEGVAVEDVVRGVHESLAARALTQLKKIRLSGPVVFVGGVARQSGMVEACRRVFGVPVIVPDEPERVAALGAAVLALRRAKVRTVGETHSRAADLRHP